MIKVEHPEILFLEKKGGMFSLEERICILGGEKIMYPIIEENVKLHLQPKESYIYCKEVFSYVERINRVGAEILEQCNGKYSFDEICIAMAERYKDEIEKVKSLVYVFLKEAEAKGYIKFSEIQILRSNYITGSKDYYVPTSISCEITRRCNLKCKHCYIIEEVNNELSTEEWLRIIENISKAGVFQIYITGGEPLIRPDIMEILQFCFREKFIVVEVATNGYLITKELAKELSQYKINIQISLDGIKDTHNYIRGKEDAFEKTIKGISLLANEGIRVMVATTLTPVNLNQLEEVVKIAKDAGASSFRIGHVFPTGRAKEMRWSLSERQVNEIAAIYDEIADKYSEENFQMIGDKKGGIDPEVFLTEENAEERINCGAGYERWNVGPNGIVTPCPPFEVPIGNITKSSIREISQSPINIFFQNLPFPNKELCGNCEKFYMCNECYVGGYVNRDDNCRWFKMLGKLPLK